jgi:hypothetical protein
MIRDYFPEDYSMISRWLSLRDGAIIPEWSLPTTGFVVPNVACGFILIMSNKCAVMEFFISNPEIDKEIRQQAFDSIIKKLELSAKELGVKLLLANSNITAIQDMAIRHEYECTGSFMSFKKEL